MVAGAKEGARKKLEAHEAKEAAKKQEAMETEDKIVDALVTEEEGNKALLKDAEGEDVEGMMEEDVKGNGAEAAAKGSSLKEEVKVEEVMTE